MSRPPLLPGRAHRGYLRRLRYAAPVLAIFVVVLLVVVLAGKQLGVLPKWAVVLAYLVPLVLYGVVLFTRARRIARANLAAVQLLEAGDPVAAADRFAALYATCRNTDPNGAIVGFNFAVAEFRLGAPARAIELLEGIERDRPKAELGGIYRQSSTQLALVHAFAGDVDAARAWLAEGRRRAATDANGLVCSGLLATAEAAIEMRTGDAAAAARALRERWHEIETHVTVEFARGVRALRAWVLESSGAPRVQVEHELEFVREAQPGSLAYLGTEWPELRAFLVREGLVNAAR